MIGLPGADLDRSSLRQQEHPARTAALVSYARALRAPVFLLYAQCCPKRCLGEQPHVRRLENMQPVNLFVSKGPEEAIPNALPGVSARPLSSFQAQYGRLEQQIIDVEPLQYLGR